MKLLETIGTRRVTSIPRFSLQSSDDQKCREKRYCQLFSINRNLCIFSKSVREDCMMSCGACNKCIDDESCKLIEDLYHVCDYVSDIKKLCPKSCGICWDNKWVHGRYRRIENRLKQFHKIANMFFVLIILGCLLTLFNVIDTSHTHIYRN